MLSKQTNDFLVEAGYGEYAKKVRSKINDFYQYTAPIVGNTYLLTLVLHDFKRRIEENKQNFPRTVQTTLGDAIQRIYRCRIAGETYKMRIR